MKSDGLRAKFIDSDTCRDCYNSRVTRCQCIDGRNNPNCNKYIEWLESRPQIGDVLKVIDDRIAYCKDKRINTKGVNKRKIDVRLDELRGLKSKLQNKE